MGRVKLKRAKVDEPMAEIAGGKRDKPALQTQQHAAPREASVVPCRVPSVPCVCFSGGSHQAALPMSSCAVLPSFRHQHGTQPRRGAEPHHKQHRRKQQRQVQREEGSSAAASFASFEDSLQKTRHRACVKRHAASCGIIPAAGEIEGPTQKTRRSHPCLISRRGTWDFGRRAAPLTMRGEFLKSDSEEQQSRCCLSGQCRASIRCFRHHTTHSLWGRGALSAAPARPPLGPWSV